MDRVDEMRWKAGVLFELGRLRMRFVYGGCVCALFEHVYFVLFSFLFSLLCNITLPWF